MSCNTEIHSSLFPQANTPWTALQFCQTEGEPASPTLAGSVFFLFAWKGSCTFCISQYHVAHNEEEGRGEEKQFETR